MGRKKEKEMLEILLILSLNLDRLNRFLDIGYCSYLILQGVSGKSVVLTSVIEKAAFALQVPSLL